MLQGRLQRAGRIVVVGPWPFAAAAGAWRRLLAGRGGFPRGRVLQVARSERRGKLGAA